MISQERNRVYLYFLSFTLNLTCCLISVLRNWNVCNRKTWISLHLWYLQFSVMSWGQTPSILLENLPLFHMTCTWYSLKHWDIWKHLSSGWAELGGTWSGWGCPCLWQGAGPSGHSRPLLTQNHFRILCNTCTGLAAAGELLVPLYIWGHSSS